MGGVRTSAAVVLAVAALVALGVPALAPVASAREPHPSCRAKRDPVQNVIAYPGGRAALLERFDRIHAYYGCDRITGRRTRLARSSGEVVAHAEGAVFAGRVVGFRESHHHDERGFIGNWLQTVDVRSGRRLRSRGGYPSHFVVSRSGSAAYYVGSPGFTGVDVRALTPAGDTLLESDPQIESESLALSDDGRVYWTRRGLPRSAPLDSVHQGLNRADPAVGGSRRCYPRGAQTLASAGTGRVYRVDSSDGETERFVACHLASGRRTLLFEQGTDGQEQYDLDAVRFVGSLVAYAEAGCLKSACGGNVKSLNMRTGARLLVAATSGARVSDLVLRSNGAAAWMAAPRETSPTAPSQARALHACSRGVCRELDHGEGLRPFTLALSAAGGLYWTSLGLPRSAPLD